MKHLLTLAIAAACLMTSGTAQAAPYPFMTKRSCEDKGGTYATTGQPGLGAVRSCVFSVEDQLVYTAGHRSETAPDADRTYYVLVVDETETCDREYQTVQLRGEEPETDEISKSDCTTATVRTCHRLQYPDYTLDATTRVDVHECESRGLE